MKNRLIRISTISITAICLIAIFLLSKYALSPIDLYFKNSSFLNPLFTNNKIIKSAPVEEARPITILFGGDIMLSRQVNEQMNKNKDYSWPFTKIAGFLRDADLTVVNLESPFIKDKDYSVPTGSFLFKANPEAIKGLEMTGIDLVSLANNHILNQGKTGLMETKEILNEANIKSIGAGKDSEEARKPEIFTIQGKKIGFLSYAYPNDNSVALKNGPGISNMDPKLMAEDVKKLKTEADIVIVTMHAGTEYTRKPNEQQKNFAHAAIDNGADAVIGHHSHWPQTWELYKNKPIIYSLGNLVFDQMWSKETTIGLIAKLSWNNSWQEIEFTPIEIRDYGQAYILEDEKEKQTLFHNLNIPINGKIRF